MELDDGDMAHVARVEIIGDTDTSVSQIINRPLNDDGAEILEWLAGLLADHNGRVPADTALAAGRAAGYNASQLARARKRSKPPIVSHKTGMAGGWEWQYEETAKNAEDSRGEFFRHSGAAGRFLQESAPPADRGDFLGAPEEIAHVEETPDIPEEIAPEHTAFFRNSSGQRVIVRPFRWDAVMGRLVHIKPTTKVQTTTTGMEKQHE